MGELSPNYYRALEDSREHHRRSKTYSGALLQKHSRRIKAIIEENGCESLLDYGAGKGLQYTKIDRKIGVPLEEYWSIPVTKYDPAWPPFAQRPVGKFDIVVVTHVLGVIPKEDLPEIIGRICDYANKVVYVGEQLGSIKKRVISDPGVSIATFSASEWMKALEPRQPVPRIYLHAAYPRDERGGNEDLQFSGYLYPAWKRP